MDTVVGTANNDTILAVVDADANSGQTLTAADQINGGAGTDTLNITFDTAAGTAMPAATISNVENFALRNVSGNTLDVDASSLPGATRVANDRSTADVAVTNLATGSTGAVIGNGVATTVDTSFGYATAAAAATLSFENGTKAGDGADDATDGTDTEDADSASVTISSAPTAVTLNSTGAANSINTIALGGAATSLTINAAKAFTVAGAEGTLGDADVTLENYITGFAADATINVTGAGAVNLGVLTANVKEVNASANTGGVTAVLGQAADKFTGGSGNDTVTLAAGPTADVAGGAGTGDRLVVTNDAFIDTAAEVGKLSGFEILRAQEAGAFTLDVSTIAGLSAIELNGTTSTTLTGLGAQTISVIGDSVGDITLTKTGVNPGGNDALTLGFDNSVGKFADGVDAGTVIANNIDSLTVNSTGGNLTGTNTNSINSLAGNTDLETVNITGDAAFSLTTGASSVDTIDASSFTGKLTVDASANGVINITGGSNDDMLIGSANDDVISGGSGKDTINGGAGNDTITTGAGVDTVQVAGTGAGGVDTITDFTTGAGGDLLNFGNFDATTNSASGAAVLQEVSAAPNSGVTFQTGTNNVLELSFDLAGNNVAGKDLDGSTDGAALLAALGQSISVANDLDDGILVAYQGGNAYVYTANEGVDGDTALAAGDIALVGVLNNVAVGSVTADNFAAIV